MLFISLKVSIMYIDKILKYFFPFIKEVILGRATIRETYKYDKRRFWAFIIITSSISINAYVIPKMISLSYDHIVMVKEIERLKAVEEQEEQNIATIYRLRLKLTAYAKALKIDNDEDLFTLDNKEFREK